MANNFILPISTQTATNGRIGVVKIGTVSSTGIDVQTDGTLFLANSGVTTGTYLKTTVDAMGRVTSGSNADIVVTNTAKVTSSTTMAAGLDTTKVFAVQDSALTNIFTVAQTGLTTIKSVATKAAGSASVETFRIESSDNLPLFQVMQNGDTKIAGVLTVSGTGTSTFAGDVNIAGKLTVAQTSTATLGLSSNDLTLSGNLVVQGNTSLGDNAAVDLVTMKAFTKIISPTTKALGSSSVETFRIEDSAATALFQVMQNGDTVIGGILRVNGTGTSTFAGDVSIGGHLTVQNGATINGIMSGQTFELTGDLKVDGSTYLGDDATADITTIKGVTTVITGVTKAAGTNAGTAFVVKSSDALDLFKVSTNGDATVGGKLTINSTGSSNNGDFTVTGNLSVQGNTTLGDNATTDTTTINGLTTIVSKATKAGGSSSTNVFWVRSSDSQDLLAVKENGDTVVGGKITISGSGSSAMSTSGDVTVTGNLTVTGNALLNGNVTLGDATNDVIQSKAALNMNSNAITSLANPTNATDAATKGYVDAAIQGLDIKASVRYATAPVGSGGCGNLAGTYAANVLTASVNAVLPNLDGVPNPAYAINDRILVKDQTDPKQNGIYIISNLGSGATKWVLTRATDFDGSGDATSGAFVFVEQGTKNVDTGWVMITDQVVMDTSNIVWSQFAGAGSVTAGTGTTVTGNQVNLAPATTTTLGGIIASDAVNTTIDASGNLSINASTTATANKIVMRTAAGDINVNAVNASSIVSSGAVSGTNITASGTLAVTNTATFTGAIVANGNVTLGDASADTLTVNATPTFNANTTFAAAATVTINGTLTANGNVNLGDATSDVITIMGKIAKVSNVAVTGNYGVQAVAANAADLVIGTTATTVATFTPAANGNHIIYLYVRMASAATLTIDLTYNDGAAQTLNILSGTQAIGSYSVSPVFIYAKTGTAVTITATAGTASAAYVSANIAGF